MFSLSSATDSSTLCYLLPLIYMHSLSQLVEFHHPVTTAVNNVPTWCLTGAGPSHVTVDTGIAFTGGSHVAGGQSKRSSMKSIIHQVCSQGVILSASLEMLRSPFNSFFFPSVSVIATCAFLTVLIFHVIVESQDADGTRLCLAVA